MDMLQSANDCVLLLIDLNVNLIASIRTMTAAKLKYNAIALATLAQMHKIPSMLAAGGKLGAGGVFLPE